MRPIGKWLEWIVWGSVVLLAMVATVQAQESGILEGQVVNGTDGGPSVGAGITVTLHVFQQEVEVASPKTMTDADGRFRFDKLNTDPSLKYRPEAVYLGVAYSNPEPYQFDNTETSPTATLTVYETTDDDSVLGLDSVHMIIESFDQVLRVSEIHLFGNTGDRTYIGHSGQAGQRTTVYIPLPRDAVGLAFQQGMPEERFVEVDGGLRDTEPVPPGRETSLVFFSYHVVVGGETVSLERRFAYPVTSLNVLVAQPGLTLRSDQLQAMGPESFQGRQYQFYATQGLAPDTPLVLELSVVKDATGNEAMPGAPAGADVGAVSTVTGSNQELLRWLGFGLLGLVLIGAMVYPLATRRPVAAPASDLNLASNPKARRLLADLADLEDAFEAGQVDEMTYERRRAEKHDALKSL